MLRMASLFSGVIVINILLLFANCLAENCKLINEDDRSLVYMNKLAPLYGKTFSTEQGNIKYNVAICGIADSKCTKGQADFSSAVKDSESDTVCTVIGRSNATRVVGNEGWVLLKYYNGENVTVGVNVTVEARTQIMITCDPDDHHGSLKVIESKMDDHTSDLFYWFELKTSDVCKKQGLSTGSVLCIMLFTSAGVYFLLGFLYSRFIVGAQGLEQIPNYSFWKNFGKLQAEGCDFACRCGERQEAKMYRGIGENKDERVSGREDRDDHLLPM